MRVELSSPKTACAMARARRGLRSWWVLRSWTGPEVDVLPLEAADLLARVLGQRGPVAVLDHDQRLVVQGEVDVPVDQRVQASVAPSAWATRARPTSSSSWLIETSISASIASLS